MRIPGIIGSLLLFTMISVEAQFVEVSSSQGVELINPTPVFGNGCSFADFNGDGWDDLSVTRESFPPAFFLNNSGNFEAIDLGIPNPNESDLKSVIWVDYDNDGDRDLFLSPNYEPLVLYRNDGDLSNMTDVTLEAGIAAEFVRNFGASWGDYNKDGFLDLYVCKYHNATVSEGYEYTNRLYMNDGDGTFTDVTDLAGVGDGVKASFQSAFLDYNNDGWPDIYVINDRLTSANSMFRNNGDGTFTETGAETGTDVILDAMSLTVGDYDNDCDLDIFITNTPEGHFLLQNDGTGNFSNVAQEAGVEIHEQGWGSLWIDYDNNSWLDLFVSSISLFFPVEHQNYFYQNNGDGTFSDATALVGIQGDMDATYSVCKGDFNNDGYTDYFTNNAHDSFSSLWENTGGSNHYLALTLEGTISNRDAAGTWVEVYSSGNKYIKYTFIGDNYISQDSYKQIFGLGENEIVDSLKLRWLSGIEESYYNLQADSVYHFIEGQSFAPSLSYEGDLILCPEESIALSAGVYESYLWSNGSEEETIVVNSAGSYSVEVSTTEGLTFQSDTVVVSMAMDPVEEILVEHVLCAGDSTGSIQLIADTSLVESIIWNNGSDELEQVNISAELFSYELLDIFGCVYTADFQVESPDSLLASILHDNPSCFEDCDGEIQEVIISGGIPPYNTVWLDFNPEELCEGTFNVQISDSNNCILEESFDVQAPAELIANLSFTDELEDQALGTAMIEVEGGTPDYLIEWSNGEFSEEIDDLEAGEYSVIITDAQDCSLEIDFEIGFVVGLEDLNREFKVYPNPCNGFLTIETEDPYELHVYDISGRLLQVPIEVNSNGYRIDLHSLSSGNYILQLLNSSGLYSIPLLKGE